MSEQSEVRVLGADEGRVVPGFGHVANRFMIDGADTGGRFALVQHLFEPRALAAPMHRHHDEDEYTFVLTGRIGAVLGGTEVVAGPGDLIFKPRGQWHTFWNATDEPADVLEIISTAGLEDLFKSFEQLTGMPAPETIAEMAGKYHVDLDFDSTFPLIERLGLVF
ncbi:cupin domain-containing protein [Streptomyces sp. A7024]|uniref:Cupin domain-containing protein n=1 Tax=Streptomyces coryli TaxID=1128680 RepID=A0A6G4U2S1_9ACTN|nr:cupin domain-containing protein [Streptomyces coryli]NGN66383.1 cupin domain-containing protein [Streptomyces coryli]